MAAEVGLFLDGLHCAGCVNRTERALRAATGVREAHVNYTNHRALVAYEADATSAEALVGVVQGLGYSATPYDPAALARPDDDGARAALVRVLVAGFLAMNVMWIAVALYTGSYSDMDPATRTMLRWVAIALSVPAATWCALPFWRGAWKGLARRELTIDVPVVLGVVTSFTVSVVGTLAGAEHLFMDSAAVIVFLILLGRTLERRARARASDAVDRLTALTPKRALRRGAEGLEEVDPQLLTAGDRVVVPAGETVPVDGSVLAGASDLDESAFTGESTPVLRRPGDSVTGGTHNLTGEFEIEVTHALDAGALARLGALLERAQMERPRVQRTVDRVATFFAPAVLIAAAATALFWIVQGAGALDVALTTAAVLIVACPCALGLATPAAVTAAVGRAARLGVLVKSGEALERCASLDSVVLDKTGTVTEGRYAVVGRALASGVTEQELLAVAAAAEGASTHPMAAAIRAEAERMGASPGVSEERTLRPAEERTLRPAEERTLWPAKERTLRPVAQRTLRPGLGVEADAGGERLLVGSRALLAEADVEIDEGLASGVATLAARGLSIAWVASGRRALGAIAAWDTPRGDAAEAVGRLEALGLRVEMATGDHERAARQVARVAGIEHVASQQSPEQKVERVRKRRALGERVLVAGDGVNDAAALAAADVGVAMARGSDVTLHAADVVIRAPRLGALPDVIGLSRATLRRIRENLGFALLYNLIAVPLAVGGWLEPLHAAVAMSGSSVVVTVNALRLLRWEPRP